MADSERKIIKVLIVAPAAPLIGGQAVQAARLIEKFGREQNLQVDLQPVNPQIFPTLQKIKYVRTVITELKYIFDLLVKIPRYDVIHIFSASYFSFLLAPTPAVLIAKLFGKKTILNYRSGEAEDHLQKWRRTVIPTIRLFDKIVMPSGYLVDVFEKFGLPAETIFNFVNTEKYPFRQRNELRPVFLSNRNFESLYNIPCTLKAFALIRQKFPDAKILIAGDGNEKENIHRLAKDLSLMNVEFLGRVSPEKMPELYAQTDIYINSPNIDNMPNSVIEAFAAGTAVVSTNAGGIPYIVENGETGLLVDVNDHEGLAGAALRLLENNELSKKIIAKAYKNCVKYSWEKVRGQWLTLYSELAKKEK